MRVLILGLCLALAGDKWAHSDLREDLKGGSTMTESIYSVKHVRLTSDRPFADVKTAFEKQLGKFDPQVYKMIAEGGAADAARAKIESMAGSSGFMLFDARDHGALLNLVGQKRLAVQYTLGNPLFAIEMTRHVTGASLYAPLRVLVYVAEDGKTRIEYDRSSSLFGQFGNEQVDRMAATLDQKLDHLAATALRR
jgi:uncharacterized protein (DUF302 family)